MTRALGKLTSPTALFLAAITVGYGFYNRSFLLSTGTGTLGQAQLILSDATNPKFVVFAVLTLWLLYVLAQTRLLMDYPVLIRAGSYRALVVASCANSLRSFATMGSLVVLCWIVTSLGLPFDGSLSASDGKPISVLTDNGIPWVVALILQLLLLTIFFTVLNLLFVTLRLTIAKVAVEVAVAGGIWVWSIISTAGFVPLSSPLNAGYSLNIDLFASSPITGVSAFSLVFAVVAGCVIAIFVRDQTRMFSAFWKSGWLTYSALVGVVMIVSALTFHGSDSPFSLLDVALAGSGGTVLQYLSSALIMLGYVFVIQFRANQQQDFHLLEIIRHGSFAAWACHVFLLETRRATIFLLSLFAAGVLIFFMTGGRSLSALSSGTGLWLFQFFINGLLQILFYVALIFAANWSTGAPIAGLVTIAALVMIGAVQTTPHLWIPVQLSGTALARSGWPSVANISITLVIAIFLVFAYLAVIFRLRLVKI